MNPISRERLFGFQHAFDQPIVLVLVATVAGVLVVAAAAIGLLVALRLVNDRLRRELIQRYVSWLIIIPCVVGPILLGAAWTMLLVAVLSLLCYREFARATGFFREKLMSLMVVVGILAVNFAIIDHWYGFFVALAPLTIIIMAAVAILSDRPKGYIQRVGLASLSFLLFGVCLGHLGYFANDTHYRSILLLIALTVALNDVFAFVVGKSLGGPKLLPNTSPNKTISGSLGALVLSTIIFAVLGRHAFRDTILAGPQHLILLGIIVSAAGQFGDLTISSIKRDVGIKDMGVVIPGHGGILDRCNSLLLTAPAVFHYIAYFHGIGVDQPQRLITGG